MGGYVEFFGDETRELVIVAPIGAVVFGSAHHLGM
jgi:hypothetical protein